MDLKIPKVLQRIDLGGYDNALLGQFLTVWVNPTLLVLREHDEMVKDGKDEDSFAWYAKVFSQGDDPETHWTADELRQAREQDPAFWMWMLTSYWEARREHIAKKKKN